MLLLYVLIAEWLFFYFAGTTTNRRGIVVGFGTWDRQFDILRHSCEIGLLALALTPVIITAGIDLSVGSLLGLSAILFGQLWHDAGLPIPLAVAFTLVLGALGRRRRVGEQPHVRVVRRAGHAVDELPRWFGIDGALDHLIRKHHQHFGNMIAAYELPKVRID
jgi:hypothetical protein